MTIKNQDKNISAERQGVVTDIQITPYGILKITFTNLHDETEDRVVDVDLSGHKLRLVKLNSIDELNALANSSDEAVQNTRATCLYLIEKEGINDEGIYEEYIWVEDEERFEVIGSTAIDLEPYFEKENIVTSWSNQTSDTKVPSEKLVKDSLNEKISKVSSPFGFVKSNGTIDENTYVTQQNFLEELGYYYTKTETDDQISDAINNIDIPEVDLNNYCTKTQISGFVLEVLTALDDELRG